MTELPEFKWSEPNHVPQLTTYPKNKHNEIFISTWVKGTKRYVYMKIRQM